MKTRQNGVKSMGFFYLDMRHFKEEHRMFSMKFCRTLVMHVAHRYVSFLCDDSENHIDRVQNMQPIEIKV